MANDITQQMVELKKALANNMATLKDVARGNGFSAPSKAFDAAEDGLNKDDFTVVVFGEQKNGKSSFVNALLGKPLCR